MLVMIDAPMINRFVEEIDSFQNCANDRFQELDGDGDGLLSREDLRGRLSESIALDHQPSSDQPEDVDYLLFDKFDVEGNRWIDREKFRPMMMEILVAMARGIGSTPVMVGVEADSLLMKAYESEVARMERKSEEANRSRKDIEVNKRGLKKKKKRSMKIFGMCACSPRYLGED